MIRPLRKRHLYMQGSLALIILIGMVQGIRSRQPIPEAEPKPWNNFDEHHGQQVSGLPLTVHLMAADTLLLHLQQPLQKPDVLAYLSSTAPTDSSLPVDVVLLGSVGSEINANYSIPDSAQGRANHFVLYSLAHQEVIGTVLLKEEY